MPTCDWTKTHWSWRAPTCPWQPSAPWPLATGLMWSHTSVGRSLPHRRRRTNRNFCELSLARWSSTLVQWAGAGVHNGPGLIWNTQLFFVDLLTCGRYSHCVWLFLYCFSSSARSCWFVTMVGIYLHVCAHAHQVYAFFASMFLVVWFQTVVM